MNLKVKKMIVKVCEIFTVVWMILVLFSVFLGIIGIFLTEPSFIHGWNRFTTTFSPFNIANTIVMLVASLPAIGAYKLKQYLNSTKGPRVTP